MFFFQYFNCFGKNNDFQNWLKDFKIKAVNEGVSEKVVNEMLCPMQNFYLKLLNMTDINLSFMKILKRI